jgi:hypothetical protein
MIIGFSGKKQSGKTTSGNFILSLFLMELKIASSAYLDAEGRIVVSDLLGQKHYGGILDTTFSNANDYVIGQVINKLSPVARIYSFADVLKQDICMNVLGLSYDQCYGSDENKNSPTNLVWPNTDNPMSARDVMQYVGTDVFRKMKSSVWVDATMNRIKKDNPKIALITDCRFPNEVQAIKDYGGRVVRLTKDPYQSDHISETILDANVYDWSNFDFIIDNKDMTILDQCMELDDKLKEIFSL